MKRIVLALFAALLLALPAWADDFGTITSGDGVQGQGVPGTPRAEVQIKWNRGVSQTPPLDNRVALPTSNTTPQQVGPTQTPTPTAAGGTPTATPQCVKGCLACADSANTITVRIGTSGNVSSTVGIVELSAGACQPLPAQVWGTDTTHPNCSWIYAAQESSTTAIQVLHVTTEEC